MPAAASGCCRRSNSGSRRPVRLGGARSRRLPVGGHVVFYRATVEQTAPRPPDWEISDSGFFSLDSLPEGTTKATYRRLAELRGERESDHRW